MPRQLTFIHAADLHIGAPFRGMRALSTRWADYLSDAIIEAYGRVIDAAVDNRVDFVLFAGDVFDKAHAAYRDYALFFQGLERLEREGIPAFIVAGNHDPLSHWKREYRELPGNTSIMSADHPDFALYSREGQPLCIIAGRSFPANTVSAGTDLAAGLTREAAIAALGEQARFAPFAVGLLHTGLNIDIQNAPTNPAALRAAGFDYWALGHIHARYVDNPQAPRMAFAGNIQGLSVNETGRRGVNLVTLEEGALPIVRFIPTASVVWSKLDVDVSECTTLGGITDKVVRELFNANADTGCDRMISRVRLTGVTPLHEALAQPGVLEDVRASINEAFSEFHCDSLENRTARPLDREALRREGLFPAELMQVADSQKLQPADTAAFLREEMTRRNLAARELSDERLTALLQDAEDLVLDLLLDGE